MVFFFQAEDGIRDLVRSRGLGDVYKRQWCREHYVSLEVLQSMGMIRRQLRSQLQECGFLNDEGSESEASRDVLEDFDECNQESRQHEHDELLLPCVLCSAMFPNLAQVRNNVGKGCTVHTKEGEAFFHPCSVNFRRSDLEAGQWFAYLEKVETSKVYIRDATRVLSLIHI
eukprot:TRINITY_DN23206_c0_g1_i1.p1 TRINITY_DN23206_c0_g1~~TRINITY_DN23206_c0_g1_i1.p1  ORF type:complete len:171 (-),score=34.90 TRINITY_DN23206_c0_g1_i1:117-629(-)